MQRVDIIQGWEQFELVEQDEPGLILTTDGGLYTKTLMGCAAYIFENEIGHVGMLHINPTHDSTLKWLLSMRNKMDATTVVVAGANGNASQDRIDVLEQALKGLAVIDETKNRWVPSTLDPQPGTYCAWAGYAAVESGTRLYALNYDRFRGSDVIHSPRRRARRGSSDGCCVIM